MKNNRQAIIRYKAIDRCLSDGKEHYFEELLNAVNKALEDNGFKKIDRKASICEAMKEMSSIWDGQDNTCRIHKKREGGKTVYWYDSPLDAVWSENIRPEILKIRDMLKDIRYCLGLNELPWLEDYLSKLKLNHDDPNIKPAIIYQQNLEYKGISLLKTLYESIVRQRPVRIRYNAFGDEEGQFLLVHPQILKQYNQRWFLFALIDDKDEDKERLCNLALDRISSISEVTDVTYRLSTFDFDAFFDSRIGVSGKLSNKRATIIMRFSDQRLKYVLTKPLHKTQRYLGDNKVKINVAITPELKTLIKSFGLDVEVLEPKWMREELSIEYSNLAKRYTQESNA